MMESMTDPVYICSPDFKVEYMNPAMLNRLGRDANRRALPQRHTRYERKM